MALRGQLEVVAMTLRVRVKRDSRSEGLHLACDVLDGDSDEGHAGVLAWVVGSGVG